MFTIIRYKIILPIPVSCINMVIAVIGFYSFAETIVAIIIIRYTSQNTKLYNNLSCYT